MALTPSQAAVVKAYILADPVMSAAPANDDGSLKIANIFNAPESTYYVWRSNTPGGDVRSAVNWANMTMNDAPDGTAQYTNTQLYNQAKQISLQTLVQGLDTIYTGIPGIRAGLQDATSNLRTGAGGAVQGAGWAAIKTLITRNATLIEKILTSGAGTAATPASLVYEGPISYTEISLIRNS